MTWVWISLYVCTGIAILWWHTRGTVFKNLIGMYDQHWLVRLRLIPALLLYLMVYPIFVVMDALHWVCMKIYDNAGKKDNKDQA